MTTSSFFLVTEALAATDFADDFVFSAFAAFARAVLACAVLVRAVFEALLAVDRATARVLVAADGRAVLAPPRAAVVGRALDFDAADFDEADLAAADLAAGFAAERADVLDELATDLDFERAEVAFDTLAFALLAFD